MNRAAAVASLIRFARLMFNVLIAAVIIGIGESIDALHRLDDVFAPHARVLRVALPSLIALGFAMFMGGIIAMLLYGGKGEGTMHLRELRAAWRDGTWRRSPRMKRFHVIAGGVALMIVAGAVAGFVFGPAGVRMLILVWTAVAAATALYRRGRAAA
ncbi:MAG TPA: hypothetical protein VNA69_17390 [Thermoanaerobaculia bacterium]|nr:hypothetical protein [Thermoanaerobaculia bacterium]